MVATLFYLLTATFTIKTIAGTSENNVTKSESVNGQSLIKLGRQMNKPMMTLIGMAIQNLHQCEDWTEWTPCEAKVTGNFGIRKRTRKCVKETGKKKINETVEPDWSLCEGETENSTKDICPSHYNITANGFCIKLYTIAKSHADADKQCKYDGGYLINIDSEEKYADVKGILASGPTDTWVGGRRKGRSNTWEFDYGKNNGFYSKYWFSSSFPNIHDCLAFENFKWFTYACIHGLPFLCEMTSG